MMNFRRRALLPSLMLGLIGACVPGLCGRAGAHAAAGIDRAAVYKRSLPLFSYDRSEPLNVTILKTKQYPECEMLRIVYNGDGGEPVPAVVFEPFRASNWHPVPGIVLLHGLGATKESLVKFGHFLAATGYASIIPEEWGQGERRQEVDTSTPEAQQSVAEEGFIHTIIDARRGIDYLQSRPHISPRRIGVLGFDVGAVIAADVAGIDDRVKASILVSGGGNLGAILKQGQKVPRDWAAMGARLADVDPLTYASHIAPRAVLMQNGTADSVIPADCARALYKAISAGPRSRVEIDWCPGGGHVLNLGLIYPHMRPWLAKNLKGQLVDEDVVPVTQ
ncbi:MAG: alpha/beta hydrolase [Capsulimonadaceae bacterium]